MASLKSTQVKDVMVTALIPVQETDKMDDVAKLFDEQDVHAAPVLTELGECVGIITSHDIVEYEAVRQTMQNNLSRGRAFDMAHYGLGIDIRWPGHHINEVGYHMSTRIEPAKPDESLSQVAKQMCAKHRHHVLVLDEVGNPVGILSSLDLLGFITGEPVCRSTSCENPSPS